MKPCASSDCTGTSGRRVSVSAKTHTFDSRQQEKWAFATKKPWARRWAEATKASGKRLPKRTARPTARTLMKGM